MLTKNHAQFGNTIVIMLGQLVVVALTLSYFFFIYLHYIQPDLNPTVYFKKTDCLLMSKRLSTLGQLVKRYRADFLISYNVRGVQYSRWVSANGLDDAYTYQAKPLKSVIARYEVGQTYTCFYKPGDPEVSLLVPRSNWLSIAPLLLPLVIGLIALYYFFRNVLVLLSLRRY